MSIILFLFLMFFSRDLIFLPEDKFNEDYLLQKQTTNMNGIFVFLVLLSHSSQYLNIDQEIHQYYKIFKNFLGQGVVVTFLMYSGYGIMQGIKLKGNNYIKSLPSKTIKLFLYFNAALSLYFLLNIFLQKSYPLRHTLLAITSWTSIGNSNWYITAVLLLYISVFISFIIAKDKYLLGICLTLFLTITIVYIQMKLNRPGYTYNTMIIFPLGMIYSYFKEYIDKFINNDLRWLAILLSLYGITSFTYFKRYSGGIEFYSVWIVSFSLILVLFSKKIILINPLLEWLGKRVFSIYILQRIPMTLLAHFNLNQHYVIFFVSSLFFTLILSLLFEKFFMKNIDRFVEKFKYQTYQ